MAAGLLPPTRRRTPLFCITRLERASDRLTRLLGVSFACRRITHTRTLHAADTTRHWRAPEKRGRIGQSPATTKLPGHGGCDGGREEGTESRLNESASSARSLAEFAQRLESCRFPRSAAKARNKLHLAAENEEEDTTKHNNSVEPHPQPELSLLGSLVSVFLL